MSELINNFEIFDVISNDIKKVIKRFYVFDDEKGYNVLFVTLNDKVFGFGSNSYGVCGFGHQMVVKEPKIIEELCDKSVIQFYNEMFCAFALTNDNKLYGWGENEFGQLGLKVVNFAKLYKPVLIEDLNDINIKQISCGSVHTLVLSSEGMVYGWGWNRKGQIGCGIELGEKISVITQLKTLKKIYLIHCSFNESFALTDNGMVYSWGHNRCCRLGHELKRNECIFEPKLIINLTNITSISSTGGNTYFLTINGNIYFCGFYYDKNQIKCYQNIPKLLTNQLNIHSLHSIVSYRKKYSIGCALSDECVYSLKWDSIERTNYKTYEEFYSNECQLTYKTYYLKLISGINENKIKINGKIISKTKTRLRRTLYPTSHRCKYL